jgi:hypothetical protein
MAQPPPGHPLLAEWLELNHWIQNMPNDPKNAGRRARMAEIERDVLSGERTSLAMPLPASADLTNTGPIAGKRYFGAENLRLSNWGSTIGGGNPNEMYRLLKEAQAEGYPNAMDLWNLVPHNAIAGYRQWKRVKAAKAAGEKPHVSQGVPPPPPATEGAAPPPPPETEEQPPAGDGAPSAENSAMMAAIKDIAERLATSEDEMRKTAAVLTGLEQAKSEALLGQSAAAQQLTALDVLSQPRASFFSQFARAPRSTAEQPVNIQAGPELSAIMRGETIPAYGTIGGPMETIENTPDAIRRAFEGAVEGLTTQSIQGMTPTALAQLGVLGQIGGYFPTDVFEARERAIPREPKLFKSLQPR